MSTPPIDWFPLSVLLDPASSSSVDTNDRLDDNVVSQHQQQHRLEVTNPSVPLPSNSVRFLPDFVSGEQAARLSAELSDENYLKYSTWEGFDGPRRRVYAFDFDGDGDDDDDKNSNERDVPTTLVELQQHLKNLTGLQASSVKIEEYSPEMHKVSGRAGQAALYDPTIISTFASPKRQDPCPCCQEFTSNSDPKESLAFASGCSCFVLEVPLVLNSEEGDVDLLQNWNLPANREAVCWQLRSPLHWTDVRLRSNTAIVKQAELLRDWRSSRVLATSPNIAGNVRVLKFYSLAKNSPANAVGDNDFSFGYVPSPDDEIQRKNRLQEPMPPLKDLLTIIVTTSPIKSNPSTEVLERAMQTFELGGSEFAYECPKIIVCDGFRTQENGADEQLASASEAKVTRKHNNAKQAMRNGIVDRDQADNYRQFKRNLRDRCSAAAARSVTDSSEAPNVFRTARVVELEERHGYGFALRHALRHCVATPFVCVIQHDRTFMRPTPVYETVKAMWLHSNIKYVGFTMRSNLMYRDLFLGKYGSGPQQEEEWNSMVLHLPELRVSASEYGPDSASTRAMTVASEKIRKSIASLVSTYKGSHQAATAQPAVPEAEEVNGGAAAAPLFQHEQQQQQLTLIPTLFWYDNIHICDTKHYRDFIFHEPFKMVARGGFVEDKLSPVIKRTVERMGLKDGHSRFGCYLLDDHSGMFFTGHLDGGSFVTEEQRKEVIALQKKKQAEDPS